MQILKSTIELKVRVLRKRFLKTVVFRTRQVCPKKLANRGNSLYFIFQINLVLSDTTIGLFTLIMY